MTDSTTYPQGTIVVLVGTKRGLFILSSQDRTRWDITPPTLRGCRIFHAILDQRNGQRLFAAENGDFFGSFLRYSDDFGETWQEPEHGIQFPSDSKLKLANIWVIEPGRPNEAGTIYAGVDPASLWISTDNGKTWEPDAALL